MRALGYWVVDRVIEHLEGLPGQPAIREGSPTELWEALGGPAPEEGGAAQEALRTLADVALAHMQHGDHPRYFARVPGPSSYAGVLADLARDGVQRDRSVLGRGLRAGDRRARDARLAARAAGDARGHGGGHDQRRLAGKPDGASGGAG